MTQLKVPDELDRRLAQISNPADAAQLARDFAALARAKGRGANLELLAYAKAARRCGELLLPEMLPRERGQTAGRNRSSIRLTTYQEAIAACQISRELADRWQKLAGIALDKFEAWIAEVEAGERDAALKGFLSENELDVHFSSETPEWYTPPEIIDRTLALLGEIDLDPCSNTGSPNVPAARCFTAFDDGLAQVWSGRVYMNPPYGDVIADWMSKLHDEYALGNVPEAIALVPARTDTFWWQDNLGQTSVCFVRGRLRFSGHENSAPFPSAVAYFGLRLDDFISTFGDLGEVRIRP